MASVTPRTVGESLYWSYANLSMAFASARHGEAKYQQNDFIVRNKTYYGLLRGELQVGSLLIDEKQKLAGADACCYCGSDLDLTVDHLIPKFKKGEDAADNLVVACRPCNSSKNANDLLEWMAKKGEFPPLVLLRRYLKIAIRYCTVHGLMDTRFLEHGGLKSASLFDELELDDPAEQSTAHYVEMPFAIDLVPHIFPEPPYLVSRYS